MLLREGNVNKQVADVCASREVKIAFRQNPPWLEFDTETNTLVGSEYLDNYLNHGHGLHYEILTPFLLSHNLILTWLDAGNYLVSRISLILDI